jgi:AcrR family transcriptional regulator
VTSAPGSSSLDGRHQRGQRTRTAIADALLDLLEAGELRPSSAQIAAQAGVTQRTLFNQFGDMDSLVVAVADRQSERVEKLLPTTGPGSRDERIDQFTLGLAELLEATMNVRWAAVTIVRADGPVDAAVRRGGAAIRARLDEAFEPELATLPDATRAEVVDTLMVEADPLVWRIRRVQQGKDELAARAGLRRIIDGVIPRPGD